MIQLVRGRAVFSKGAPQECPLHGVGALIFPIPHLSLFHINGNGSPSITIGQGMYPRPPAHHRFTRVTAAFFKSHIRAPPPPPPLRIPRAKGRRSSAPKKLRMTLESSQARRLAGRIMVVLKSTISISRDCPSPTRSRARDRFPQSPHRPPCLAVRFPVDRDACAVNPVGM